MKQKSHYSSNSHGSNAASSATSSSDNALTGMAANVAAVEAIEAVLRDSVHMSATVPSLPVKSVRGLLNTMQSCVQANQLGKRDAESGAGGKAGSPAIDMNRCSRILTRDYSDAVPSTAVPVGGAAKARVSSQVGDPRKPATSYAFAASTPTRGLDSRADNNNSDNSNPLSAVAHDSSSAAHSSAAGLSGVGTLHALDFDTRLDFIKTNRVVAVLERAMERLQLLDLLNTGNAAAAAALHETQQDGRTEDSGDEESHLAQGRHGSATVAIIPSMMMLPNKRQDNGSNTPISGPTRAITLTQAEQDKILSTMFGVRHRGVTRMAASFGPSSTGATLTATTAAIAQATTEKEDYVYSRSRCTVAQLLAEQQQLEARYGELLQEARADADHNSNSRTSKDNNTINNNSNDDNSGAVESVLDPQCFSRTQHTSESRRQQELASVARQLREHNRMLCIQLKDNPKDADNWNKICAERTELLYLLQRAVSELTSGYAAAIRQTRIGAGGGDVSSRGLDTRVGRTVPSTGCPRTGLGTSGTSWTMSQGAPSRANASCHAAEAAAGGVILPSLSGAVHSSQSCHGAQSRCGDTSTVDYAAVTNNSTVRSFLPSRVGHGNNVSLHETDSVLSGPSRRFGHTLPMRYGGVRHTSTQPRLPLHSVFTDFAHVILQEWRLQRWGDGCVREARDLNQNVKQLQSDLAAERASMEQEVSQRLTQVHALRTALRRQREALRCRRSAAVAVEAAIMESEARVPAEEANSIARNTSGQRAILAQENLTHRLFVDHLEQRTAVMDGLAGAWERQNEAVLKTLESHKMDAQQARQHCAEQLEGCESAHVAESELQRRREEQQAAQEAARMAREQRRQSEYEAASILEAAIKGFFTRQALIKLRKGKGKGKKKANGKVKSAA